MSEPTHPDADNDVALAEHLLAAAIARAHGNQDANAAIGRLLDQLHSRPTDIVFAVMHAWVVGAAAVVPLPEGVLARADCEARLGQEWPLAKAEPGVRTGFQVFAALANSDLGTAAALWDAALADPETSVRELAAVAVLHRAALILSQPRPHTTPRSER